MSDMFDCAVIGAGPAGLSAALNLRQRGKTPCIVGNTSTLLAKAERVDNYLGLPEISGQKMMEVFESHVRQAGLNIQPGRVVNILPMGDFFMLNANSQILQARTVILCGGVYRGAELPGEVQFLGQGVSYCATCDGMLYKGKKVVVWGLSESAVEEADFLASLGCQVTYVAASEPAGKHGFAFLKGRLSAVEGDMKVTGVQVGNETLACDGVFILREGVSPAQLVPGLETQNGHIQVNREMATNIPGLFAAGDCTGAPYQVAKAVGEGLTAALTAAAYLDKLNKDQGGKTNV